MSHMSMGKAALFTLGGVILGIVISRTAFWGFWGPPTFSSPGGAFWGRVIGVPELMVFVPLLLFVAFWVLLIGALFNLGPWGKRRGYYAGRLEDLPADFDDWHRRAHERMREAASADDPGRRG
jgi:hypothetical protein